MKVLRSVLTTDILITLFEKLVSNAGEGDSASINFLSKHIARGKISIGEIDDPSTLEKS